MRLIIYTGKGGVGKTSTSAATAYKLSELGYRTLLMSTDSAHSLGDSLDMELPTTVTNVKENLDVLEVDIIHEMKFRWSEIQDYISAFMLSQGMGEISAEEMAILPGMEMIAALFYVNQFNKDDLYDVIVMDTAPTGETLRLMSFPDITNWYLEKGFNTLKRIMNLARATVGKLMEMAVKMGKSVRPDMHLGICGEHGGDPSSVEFCHKIGLSYVSCSPFRVPIARLAAAQAAIADK